MSQKIYTPIPNYNHNGIEHGRCSNNFINFESTSCRYKIVELPEFNYKSFHENLVLEKQKEFINDEISSILKNKKCEILEKGQNGKKYPPRVSNFPLKMKINDKCTLR